MKSTIRLKPASGERVPVMPLITVNGIEVLTSATFQIRDPLSGARFRYSLIDIPCSDEILSTVYTLLREYLSTRSLNYATSAHGVIRDLLTFAAQVDGKAVQQITLRHLSAFIANEREQQKRKLSFVMAFLVPYLRRWKESGHGGLDDDLMAYLKDAKAHVDGFEYRSLRTRDPERGPLTGQELGSLHAALNAAFAERKLTLEEYALAWLFMGTGMRPIQVSRMRIGDIRFEPGPSGMEVYLDVSLAKGQGAYTGTRWGRRCPTVLAEILVHARDTAWLAREHGAPLFANEDGLPVSPTKLRGRLSEMIQSLDTHSERLNGRIPIFPYRFRYSMGTRAIEHGANDYQVARLLTHRSTYSIKHYCAATPGVQKVIAASLGESLETIAKAFQGKVRTGLSGEAGSEEVSVLLRDFERLSGRAVGACGSRTACYQHAPIACLTCRYFEAFDDAPIAELVESLRQEQLSEREPRIAAIYDAAIVAGREIMALQRNKGPAKQ